MFFAKIKHFLNQKICFLARFPPIFIPKNHKILKKKLERLRKIYLIDIN